ncbi:SRPBCC family protein [Hyalangium versicolor]|uniref:SRPBCC family protein n=1 Tax=Hyalangium versicolor TaxID=2861190 RepID=UPI001CCBF0A6|nr:SRPBCC family protein [Hyalangium versicolor]
MLEAKYRVYDSAVLDAPIEEVWPVVRDLVRLLPLVFGEAVKGHGWVEGGSAENIPSRFQFTLQPSGETILEEVVGRSETEHSVTYRMIGQAVGITGYIATYQLRPITSEPGKTFLDWVRDFAVAPGNDPAKVAPFLAGLTAQEVVALKKHFAQRF